ICVNAINNMSQFILSLTCQEVDRIKIVPNCISSKQKILS
ncbi:5353_t:CDS:2, partial [Dentiscutata heterogama]